MVQQFRWYKPKAAHLWVQKWSSTRGMRWKRGCMSSPGQASEMPKQPEQLPSSVLDAVQMRPKWIRLEHSQMDGQSLWKMLQWKIFKWSEENKRNFHFYSHSHDDSTDVIRMVSFGFRRISMPVNDGITSDDRPSNRFLFTIIELLMRVTKIWRKKKTFLYHRIDGIVEHSDRPTCGAKRRNELMFSVHFISLLALSSGFFSHSSKSKVISSASSISKWFHLKKFISLSIAFERNFGCTDHEQL